MGKLKKIKVSLLATTMGLSMVGCEDNSKDESSYDVYLEEPIISSEITTENVTLLEEVSTTVNNYLQSDRYVSLTDGLGWLKCIEADSKHYGSVSSYLENVFGIKMDLVHAERFNTMLPKMVEAYERCIDIYQAGDYSKIHNSLCQLYDNSLNESDVIYLYSLKINSIVGKDVVNDFSNVTFNEDMSINVDGINIKSIYNISDDSPNIINVYHKRVNTYKSDAAYDEYQSLKFYAIPYLLFQEMGHRVSFATYSDSEIEKNPSLANEVFVNYNVDLNKILSQKLNEINDALGYDVKDVKQISVDDYIMYAISDYDNEVRFFNSDFDLAREYCNISTFSYDNISLSSNIYAYDSAYVTLYTDVFNSDNNNVLVLTK